MAECSPSPSTPRGLPFADRYDRFADLEAAGQSAIYESWARGVHADAAMRDRIRTLPPAKQQPNLVFACSRLLGAPETLDYGSWRDWVVAHWERLVPEVLARSTQTNEPRRCASLLPAIADIREPIALIEVGASAGLCLVPDRYSYAWGDARLDPDDGPSTVLLECDASGPVPLPERMPRIVHRAGVDLHPLDVAAPDDLRWLSTLVWPEQIARRERILAAADIVRADPPTLVAGDLVAELEPLVHAVPSGARVVVLAAGVLVYLSRVERERFVELVRDLDVACVTLEGQGVVPGVQPEGVPPAASFALARDGGLVGFAGPHGQRLEWLAPVG